MIAHDCKLTDKGNGRYALAIDGVDISDKTRSFSINVEAGCLPVVCVELICKEVDIDLGVCEVVEEPCET